MCRIFGIWSINKKIDNLKGVSIKARDSMIHGGPDDAGIFINEKEGLALTHRRLSILDLSSAGRQPMVYGNLVITYNGEVYNFPQIREELRSLGYKFETGTDTEVILKAFHRWGKSSVNKFRGMFAFAIWDSEKRELTLCRDRVGVKPLYWYYKDGVFMFSSELKAFFQVPDFNKEIDLVSVSELLQYGYITAPKSIFKYARKLTPGHFLTVNSNGDIREEKYWDVFDTLKEPIRDIDLNFVEDKLTESFRLRTIADVPVGVFLSGGIDSSLVATLLQKNSSKPIKSFTIGFQEREFDESSWARKVAEHIGAEHYELTCTEKELLDIVPKLPHMYDEPFGDSSAIPTHLVSTLAKGHVKVVLSGDGGDEIFGGYVKYEIAKRVFSRLSRVPKPVRKQLKKVLETIGANNVALMLSLIPYFRKRYKGIPTKVSKFINVLDSEDVVSVFLNVGKFIPDEELDRLLIGGTPYTPEIFKNSYVSNNSLISLLGALDMLTYLPDDILVKVDRASMYVSLEAREPFIDPEVISLGLSLPDNWKIKGNKNKYLLRKILYRYVPPEFIDRPKQGFGIPISKWLSTALKGQLLDMCGDKDFYEMFTMNQELVHERINMFLRDITKVNPYFIWNIYMLWLWYRYWF